MEPFIPQEKQLRMYQLVISIHMTLNFAYSLKHQQEVLEDAPIIFYMFFCPCNGDKSDLNINIISC